LRADDAEGSLSLIDNRIKEGMRLAEEQGIPFDPSDTLEIRDDILAGPEGIARARNKLDALEQTSIDTGFFKGGRQEKRTATSKDFDRFQGFIAKAKESGLPEDEAKATQFGRRAGFIRETEQESADIKVNAAERKEVAKFNVKRKQGFIESGIDAADSTANIRRSLDLLKNVETGGFDNIALKLKSAFGVEGANELELSNNLGKSVLQQLKPLFGSAFTVQEGNKLERISAKFGSSTEANVRLLNQMLRISERGARRGLAAAEDQGDVFTADEIRKSLAFKLDDKDVSSDTPPPPPTQTATGPNGEKIQLVNGQWVPL
jgi:hypothetical protein